ncbi:hypothetical protein F5884DRAFT_776984 [Xylogone sp. PMI_703]|nr:hypothetical protein F5884DRAFT_776984 [Xylogone sp. PMI_703]
MTEITNLYNKGEAILDSVGTMIQNYHASKNEERMRKERGFHETESELPNIRIAAPDHRPTLTDRILSLLGKRNPLTHPISADDTLWLLDNTAYKDTSGQWRGEFVAAVFDQSTGVEVSTVVADIAEKVGLGKGDAQEATIRQRLMPFMQSILPGRVTTVDFNKEIKLKLGPGGTNAISSDIKVIPRHNNGEIITSKAVVPKGTNGILEMKTVYAEPTGWGVISDIDDTIKITQTGDPIGILKSTFVSDPQPTPGMPEFYTHLQNAVTKSAPFFYLSASPYNLYSFLRSFQDQYYPHGTMILRDASWMSLAGLLSSLTLGTQQYKVDRMNKIYSWLPQRKMICIGDSTQSDPEAYGEIYRKYPGWIQLILIRKVTDIAAVGIEEKNEPARFEEAFKGIPSSAWHVFEDPQECYQMVSDVTKNK